MKSVIILIKEIGLSIRYVWHSKFRWLVILVLLWVFRVTAMPADDAGIAKGLQVVTIMGMLLITGKYSNKPLLMGWRKGNSAVRWMMAYLLLGMVSTLWSFVPQFSFFLSFEKIVLISVSFVALGLFVDFLALEKFMLLALTGCMLFEAIVWRTDAGVTLLTHSLTNGTCAAMLLSYSIGEWLVDKIGNRRRIRLFKGICMLSILVLIGSTSGGANASAALGVAIAFFLSGNIVWALLLMMMVVLLYLNQDWMDNIIRTLMPGKTETDITTATGRSFIWERIRLYAAEKPLLGWGYASIERLISVRDFPLTDAHNNWYGAYGGTGLIGLILLIMHQISLLFTAFKRKMKPGYTGLTCALSCATFNGYSFGYISGKACTITLFYFIMMVAVVRFEQLLYDHK